jgi:photosystem II stability/assembly factor-like uncharacterized protein
VKSGKKALAFGILTTLLALLAAMKVKTSLAAAASRSPIRPWDELFGVTIKSSSKCYVVGAEGLLLASSDGGRTWQRRKLDEGQPGTALMQDYDLYSIRFAPGAQSGWIVGEQGLVLHSTDGGETWKRQKTTTQNALLSVAAASDKVASAVGDHGALLWTSDGGEHWNEQTMDNLTFFDVAFSDEKNTWAVGEFQTIIHSSDGGKTWQAQRGGQVADFTTPPYFIVFPTDANHVLVAGQSGVLAATNDGGKTWKEDKLPVDISVFGVAGGAGASQWLVGARGAVFHSKPGGGWNVEYPTFQELTGVAVADGFELAIGLDGTLLRSEGTGWQAAAVSK